MSSSHPILFSDFFQVDPEVIDSYGAFNVSLLSDLPLFIDPFLLFQSEKPEYRDLHEAILRYLRFLKAKSESGQVTSGLLQAWYHFKEVKETWLGFTEEGNSGRGLGSKFASALNTNFPKLFETNDVTESQHLEKLALFAPGVGRDMISDFTTNLIKGFLLDFTQAFTLEHVRPELTREFPVSRVSFNYDTETWAPRTYALPAYAGSYVILVPKDLLTRQDTWINRSDLYDQFRSVPQSIPDEQLRDQVNNYFNKMLPRHPKARDYTDATAATIAEFPILLDYFIKMKEETGDRAVERSKKLVSLAQRWFLENFKELADLLAQETAFYKIKGDSYDEAMERVGYLRHVIEDQGGWRLFYDDNGRPIQDEKDLHIAYRLCWYGTEFSVDPEVNGGRGPADYVISYGAKDKTVVEFKLASNSGLTRNLQHQAEIYQRASDAQRKIKVIMYFHPWELNRVERLLKSIGLEDTPDIVLIDASPKTSASKADNH